MDWSNIRNFSEKEFAPPDWPEDRPVPMVQEFVESLDDLRAHTLRHIVVHHNGGFATQGHSPNSMHYRGLAADVSIMDSDNRPLPFTEQACLAWKNTDFSIGIYAHWNHPGLHVDARWLAQLKRVFWYCQKNGEYVYSVDFHETLSGAILDSYRGGAVYDAYDKVEPVE